MQILPLPFSAKHLLALTSPLSPSLPLPTGPYLPLPTSLSAYLSAPPPTLLSTSTTTPTPAPTPVHASTHAPAYTPAYTPTYTPLTCSPLRGVYAAFINHTSREKTARKNTPSRIVNSATHDVNQPQSPVRLHPAQGNK